METKKTNIFQKIKDSFKSTPLINQPVPGISMINSRRGIDPDVNYEMLWNQFRRSPEAIALISAIVEDILSDGWFLDGGRNSKKKAETFLAENYFKELLTSFLFDVFITGDGYIYKVKPSPSEIKSVLDRVSARIPQMKEEIKGITFDEDSFSTRRLIVVPASTMTVKFNKHGDAEKYFQTVKGFKEPATFTPEEIVHWAPLKLDGRFYGFTPFQSIINEMNVISQVKDYADFFFSQGGVPNYMFILEEETPDSPNYKKFVERLQQFSQIQNKYKSMVMTGKVEAKELNRMTKDMQFRELAQYMTQVMVMVWGVPASRLSELLISKGVQAGTSNTEGYYRKINHFQDMLEDIINHKILREFKVTLKFKRTYKQDEVREVQIDQIKTDTAHKLLSQGLVTPEWAWRYLRIPEDMQGDYEKKQEENKQNMMGGGFPGNRQGQVSNQKLMESSADKMAANKKKQDTQLTKK